MNIISNNCCGGFCYKYTNTEYNNPFMFASTQYKHLMYLLLGQINFAKFAIEETIDPCGKGKCYDIIVDNKIRICYVHHIRDDAYSIPTISGINVYYRYIYKYLVDRYIARCKRMCALNEKPVFLLAPHPGCGSVDDLCNLAMLCQDTHTAFCIILPMNDTTHPIYKYVPSERIILSNATDKHDWVSQTMKLHYKECLNKLYA